VRLAGLSAVDAINVEGDVLDRYIEQVDVEWGNL